MVDGGAEAASEQLAAELAALAFCCRRREAGALRGLDHRLQRESRQSEEGAHREGREGSAAPVGELLVVDLELQRVHRLLELRLDHPLLSHGALLYPPLVRATGTDRLRHRVESITSAWDGLIVYKPDRLINLERGLYQFLSIRL